MRRGILRSWSVAVLCSLVLSMTAPLVFSAPDVESASSAPGADEDAPGAGKSAPGADKGESGADEGESGADKSAPGADKSAPGADEGELEVNPPEDSTREKSTAGRLDDELADAAAYEVEKPKRSQASFLVWMYQSLKFRYVVIFLILTFNSVALIVMIVLGMRRNSVCPDDLAAAFEAKLNQKQYQDAFELAKGEKSFLGKVLAAGMSKTTEGHEAVHDAMQEVGEELAMRMEQRNGYIALIAQIGPMFGLLGTVDGMVMAFDVIANTPATPKPSELAVGIGTALVTTIVGLWIAIPLMVFYHIVRNRMARLMIEVGAVSSNLMKRFEAPTALDKKS